MINEYDEDDVAPCDRCGDIVGNETFIRLGDQKICENCWDDM
jgi:formylmethanofuran dehydrogenase subunit E